MLCHYLAYASTHGKRQNRLLTDFLPELPVGSGDLFSSGSPLVHRCKHEKPGTISLQALLAALALSGCGGNDVGYEVRITWNSWPEDEKGFLDAGSDQDHFSAEVAAAPPDGAVISGMVRLEVAGRNMHGVELLPPLGYVPVYIRFAVSRDGKFAYADLDTRGLPNGALEVRISAFNPPLDKPGGWEIIAMRSRTWNVLN